MREAGSRWSMAWSKRRRYRGSLDNTVLTRSALVTIFQADPASRWAYSHNTRKFHDSLRNYFRRLHHRTVRKRSAGIGCQFYPLYRRGVLRRHDLSPHRAVEEPLVDIA